MAIDLKLVLRGVLQGLTAKKATIDEELGIAVFELVDQNGRIRVLELRDPPEAEPRLAPVPPPALTPPELVGKRVEPPPLPAPAPKPAAAVALKPRGTRPPPTQQEMNESAHATLDFVAMGIPNIGAELKALMQQLKDECQFQDGDIERLLEYMGAARDKGDYAGLKAILQQRRRLAPVKRAAPPGA